MLARREEEEEEDDDDDDDDDVELTEEEVRAFREYRQTEELHARLGFALTDKALSPMRGEAPERRKNPNPSSSSPNSTPGKKKKSSPAAEADRAARAARAVLADMAAANKSLMDAAVASPDAFRLTHERTRRAHRDIGLAETDKAADEIIELTSASASIARQKKGVPKGVPKGKGAAGTRAARTRTRTATRCGTTRTIPRGRWTSRRSSRPSRRRARRRMRDACASSD